MDIVTTSLEALLQRATNPQNENVDKAAVEAFCAVVNKENEGAHIAIRLLATKIHAQNEREALQTLGVLDACMKKCGTTFQAEVGKFRFLNEMIKLVSPKYLGSQTPLLVRSKVLQLLQVWTEDYPRETKIKEAFDMLKKQGVVTEPIIPKKSDNSTALRTQKPNSIFDNDERSRLLQKLLQSKNPDDLQAANRLIKTMVKEDDKRAELVSKRVIELEAVHNNIRLLNEMLDNYRPGQSSTDEIDLIKELYQSCERLRPNVYRLASETQQNEEMLKEVLQANDELGQVFNKYTTIIIRGKTLSNKTSAGESLLDLNVTEPPPLSLLDNATVVNNNQIKKNDENKSSNIDALSDIFSSTSFSPTLESLVLQPTTVNLSEASNRKSAPKSESEQTNTKKKVLEDLDVLGEFLIKENLCANRLGQSFNRTSEKVPMNLLPKQNSIEQNTSPAASAKSLTVDLDLNYLLHNSEQSKADTLSETLNEDDKMVDLFDNKNDDNKSPNTNNSQIKEIKKETESSLPGKETEKTDIKPLTNISVTLESVKPSSIPPLSVLEDKNGISVVFHFAKDKPRDDVQVIVVTTINKNTSPLTNYHFQAVVPKICKIKLQSPSSTELPAHNPFLPPSAITQIMLIANPNNENIYLKFMISFMIGDEMCSEMGEVESVPFV